MKSELNQKEKTCNNSNNEVNKETLYKINSLLIQLYSYIRELDNKLVSNIPDSEKRQIEGWRDEIKSISNRLEDSRDYVETKLKKQINFKNNRKPIGVGS